MLPLALDVGKMSGAMQACNRLRTQLRSRHVAA